MTKLLIRKSPFEPAREVTEEEWAEIQVTETGWFVVAQMDIPNDLEVEE
jgi:hypothetical protein